MKKTITLMVVLCFVLIGTAQKSKREEGIKLGIKGGLNIANVYGDVKDNAIRTSIHAGFLAEIIVNDKFSVQPEIVYSGQGYSNQSSLGYSRVKLDYVTLPVMAKFYLYKNDLSLEAGPQVGFLVSGKSKTTLANSTISDISKVDFGLNLGLGYELKSHVFFQTRYNLGITNINSNSITSGTTKYSNANIQVSVGYLF